MKETGKGKGTVIRGILAGFLLFYLFFALLISHHLFASQKYQGAKIKFNTQDDPDIFIAQSYAEPTQGLVPDSTLLSDIDFSKMEKSLKAITNIEDAKVNFSSNGKVLIEITPVIPVARVFDRSGYSYYINREGKKVKADIRFHKDVPIISGFVDDSIVKATDLLPLVEFINRDSLWNNLTTALKVQKNGDVILIPAIKGHVVNLGNWRDHDYADKFNRLLLAYKEIMPNKGWLFYDTISLKYNAQIVGTKTVKKPVMSGMIYELADSEEVSLDNMSIIP